MEQKIPDHNGFGEPFYNQPFQGYDLIRVERIIQSIAFKIKILFSVGDGREMAYPRPAAFPKSLS